MKTNYFDWILFKLILSLIKIYAKSFAPHPAPTHCTHPYPSSRPTLSLPYLTPLSRHTFISAPSHPMPHPPCSHPPIQARDSDLKLWWILNLARSICGVLGWMATVITPTTNRIHTMLENLLDEDILPIHTGDHNI